MQHKNYTPPHHSRHIMKTPHIPIVNISTKRCCSTKHQPHIGDFAHIPLRSVGRQVLIKTHGIFKHVLHVRHIPSVPSTDILVKSSGPRKGTFHGGHPAHIPTADVLIETARVFKQADHLFQ